MNRKSSYPTLAATQGPERILAAVDGALAGEVALRPEWARGL